MFIYVTSDDKKPLILSTARIIKIEKAPLYVGSIISLKGGDTIYVVESAQEIWSMLRPEHVVPKKEDGLKENKSKGIFNKRGCYYEMLTVIEDLIRASEDGITHRDDIMSKMQDKYPEGCNDFSAALNGLENTLEVFKVGNDWYALAED